MYRSRTALLPLIGLFALWGVAETGPFFATAFQAGAAESAAPPVKAFFDRNYYTSEKEARAIVLLDPVESGVPRMARLEVRPEGADPVVAQAAVEDPARAVVGVPLAGLPLGTHASVLRIVDAAGKTVAEYALTLRREKPGAPPVREVKTDRDRMIALVDGKPFFPIGLYGVPPEQMKAVREAGFNCTIFWGGQGGSIREIEQMPPDKARAALRRYLDAAHAAGLLVIEWPPNYAKESLSYADPGLPRKMDEFLQTRLPRVIEAQRDHPALLAYYSLDEPSGDFLRRSVADESRITTKLDPYHPNYVLFCVAIEHWPEMMDVAGLDWYPQFGRDRVVDCLRGARQAAEAAQRLRVPEWHVPLCERSSASGRSITGAEQRAQTYLAVIGGVNGLIWWVWPPRHEDNWGELRKLARELGALAPALTSPPPRQVVVHQPPDLDGTVQASVRTMESRTCLITCNASPVPARAALQLPARFVGRAEVMFEDRHVELREGRLEDTFAGYGTHVYLLDAPWPPAGTLTISVALQQPSGVERPVENGDFSDRENLICDGGFEGPGYWVFTSRRNQPGASVAELTDQTQRQGKRCAMLRVSDPTEHVHGSGWTATLLPRTRYAFGCYGRAELAADAQAGVYLQGPFPAGQYVREATTLKLGDRSPGWQRHSMTFTTRDHPLVVRPCLFLEGGRGTAWFDDLFLVSLSEEGETLNLVENSSFERESLPSWPAGWWTWASRPGYVGPHNAIWGLDDSTAYDGKRSLRMSQLEWTGDTYRLGLALDVSQERVRVEAGEPYTLSAYLKADRPRTRVWFWLGYLQPQVVLVDTEWKRLSVTFTPKQGTDQAFVRISMQSAGTLWADAVQFERGDRATAYQPPAPETAGKDR